MIFLHQEFSCQSYTTMGILAGGNGIIQIFDIFIFFKYIA